MNFRRILFITLGLAIIPLFLYAQPSGKGVVSITEEDGNPIVFPWQIKVTNGALTDNGDGTASLAIGGGTGGYLNFTTNETQDIVWGYNLTLRNLIATGTIKVGGNWTLPIGNGSNTQVLKSNGDGTASWAVDATGGDSANQAVNTTSDVTFGNISVTGNISGATYGSDGTVSDAELLYINSLSSNAQTQLNAKALATQLPNQDVNSTSSPTFAGATIPSITGNVTGNSATTTEVGAVTNTKVCQGDGDSVECDLDQDASGDCAAGDVCIGGHSHSDKLDVGATGGALTAVPVANISGLNNAIHFTITNGTSAITAGWAGQVRAMTSFTATAWEIYSTDFTKGNITVAVYKFDLPAGAHQNFTIANYTLTSGSENLTLAGSTFNEDTSLGSFNTTIAAGEYYAFNVTVTDTVKNVCMVIRE